MRVLTPAARPKRPLPRFIAIALVATLVTEAAAHWVTALEPLAGLAGVAMVIAVCLAAARLEERLFFWLAPRPSMVRVLGQLMIGAAGVAAALAVGLVLSFLPDALGFTDWLIGAGAAFALWWGGAVTGSLPVLLIDVVVSALVPGFRRRVQLAVLSLLGLLLTVAAVLSATVVEVLAQLRARTLDPTLFNLTVDDRKLSGEQVVELANRALEHPAQVVLGALGVALVLGLPALWSATGKLADAVMERINPLSQAFDEVAHGHRDVRVEEGGSTELAEMTRRFNTMLDALTLAERMERAFGVYVSQHVLERIRAQHGDGNIPPSLREATVFFADIRGFTSMSEKLSPADVVAVLNRYFARVVPVIERHGGYLNKFVGDAVVVVFNGPMDQPDHAERATRCALDVQREILAMNAERAFPELKDIGDGVLKVGVGVATGPMVCGNIGSVQQMEYTVIGDTVNLSSRLTGQAKAGDVVVSEATNAALSKDLVGEAMEPVTVKGKEQPVRPFRLRPD
ncbi:MAG: HAMP domain-containing protein [Deltaproteobacteria bacterium]|nr:HAMP domain-containing protein [Deltaproteobacteria bacterium]